MNLRVYDNVIRWFQNCLNIKLVIFYLIRNLRNPLEKIPKRKKESPLVIVGTGPSVKSDVEKILEDRKKNDYMVLNGFALSKLFVTLQPEYYIFVDPLFFVPVTERNNKVKETLQRIQDQVEWPMKIILPSTYKDSNTHIKLRENTFLSFEFFPYKPIIGGTLAVSAAMMSLGLASPHFKNVLVASIHYGILLGYRELKIFGSDHSWHEEMRLSDEKTLEISDRQFYSGTTNWIPQTERASPLRPQIKFKRISEVLESYDYLRLYAEKNDVKIRNLSSKSWIDAFHQ